MTAKLNDTPEGHEETPAMRLRQARENLNLSRAELARRTGISPKVIEKFEYGSQEPSLSRIKSLSEALEVTTLWIMGEEETSFKQEEAVVTMPGPKKESANENDPMAEVILYLEEIDDFRNKGFEGAKRGALALVGDLKSVLKYLEPEQLVKLASDRNLYQCEKETPEDIDEMFSANLSEGQEYCGSIEERIVDTALLGMDLYWLNIQALVALANSFDIEFISEGTVSNSSYEPDHMEVINALRDELRMKAMSRDPVQLDDESVFTKREPANHNKLDEDGNETFSEAVHAGDEPSDDVWNKFQRMYGGKG